MSFKLPACDTRCAVPHLPNRPHLQHGAQQLRVVLRRPARQHEALHGGAQLVAGRPLALARQGLEVQRGQSTDVRLAQTPQRRSCKQTSTAQAVKYLCSPTLCTSPLNPSVHTRSRRSSDQPIRPLTCTTVMACCVLHALLSRCRNTAASTAAWPAGPSHRRAGGAAVPASVVGSEDSRGLGARASRSCSSWTTWGRECAVDTVNVGTGVLRI